MKPMLIAGSLIAAGVFSLAAQAAEPVRLAMLTEVTGKVLVNSGKGYVTAKSGTALTSGDRVISLDGSHAAVVFADGCKTDLPENSLIAVETQAQCGKAAVRTGSGAAASAGGVQSAKGERILLAQALGAGSKTDAPSGNGNDKKDDDNRIIGFWTLGGVVGLGAVAVGTAKSNDRPISQQ